MISPELEEVIKKAYLMAKDANHAYLSIEHLLKAIIDNHEGAIIINNCGGDIKEMDDKISGYLATIEKAPEGEEPLQTISFQRTLHKALIHAQSAEKAEVEIGDVLVALFDEKETHALNFILTQGIRRLDILKYLSHGISKAGHEGEVRDAERTGARDRRQRDNESPKQGNQPDFLDLYAENWSEMAREGKFDKLIGRKREIERTIEILCRRVKNNPIHVGDPGVGKTAITQGLAQAIVQGKVPDKLKGFVIYSLDLGGMVAGTRFRGDFEERLKGVLAELKKRQNVILYIDEIHTIVGAGAVGSGSLDASNIIKPAISSGELRCIGSSTYEEYKNHFEKDRALSRRFQKVDIAEPSPEDTLMILEGLKAAYELFHNVKYQRKALEAAAELSAKYINDNHLPDKAIDVMDEAGAHVSLYYPQRKTVSVLDIEKTVAKIAKIPVKTVSDVEKENLKDLETNLTKQIFHQDKAIAQITSSIKRNRAGLGHPEKPIGSFLFCGPTGVGKTELCRVLSKTLGIELIRFDMSEYMEKHTVARLIGAPAGYIGFEQGGLLTNQIRKHPNCVLLLDEIEKAHLDIYNVLLQIMDHATLTDNTGRKADFRNVILVMTSNIGSREMSSQSIGFQQGESITANSPKKAIENHFSPEFRNRLDDIVIFGHLDEEAIKLIVGKFMKELQEQLGPRKVVLEYDQKAENYLAEKGYDPAYGARPMAKVIQNEIKNPLVDEILFGKLRFGGKVSITIAEDMLSFSFK
ncbi:MAG: ATP-dependent Clp protease ATP-binding subunit ClpA [Spirochaetales bacterium]|nr:ATP-dependent Clp protease ATP-binding subunit ClpA [Spirochaetales bacterium]